MGHDRHALGLGWNAPQGRHVLHRTPQMKGRRLDRDLTGLDTGAVQNIGQQTLQRGAGRADDLDHLMLV
ncbi:hypothetical protein D3C75_1039770 [compost metagenome]